MAVLLKQQDKEIYIKSVDWASGKVHFTDKPEEAKTYKGDWFADAEKEQLQHYAALPYEEGGLCGDHIDAIPELFVYFT